MWCESVNYPFQSYQNSRLLHGLIRIYARAFFRHFYGFGCLFESFGWFFKVTHLYPIILVKALLYASTLQRHLEPFPRLKNVALFFVQKVGKKCTISNLRSGEKMYPCEEYLPLAQVQRNEGQTKKMFSQICIRHNKKCSFEESKKLPPECGLDLRGYDQFLYYFCTFLRNRHPS